MKAEELRSLQAPLKERYREQPETARVTLNAEGRLGEGVSCNVATSKAMIAAERYCVVYQTLANATEVKISREWAEG